MADKTITFFEPNWTCNNRLQLSGHKCGKHVIRELIDMFPNINIDNHLIAIVTMQHSKYDLVNFNTDVDKEKDDLLEIFMVFANEICDALIKLGHFADFIDPCSGLPMKTTDSNKTYSEVYGAEKFLGYRSQNAGCCKVLLHPQWGSAVYPATLFTTAPAESVTELLDEYCQKNV